MPALSPTMKRGKIGSWIVKTGEVVEIGQVLAEIETDKAIMEFESTDEGILGAILFPEGSEVEVGTQIAWLLESQDELTPDQIDNDKAQLSTNTVDLQNNDKVNTETEGKVVLGGTITVDSTPQDVVPIRQNAHSTPAARARARALGVDITQIHLGRKIREADVIQYCTNQDKNIHKRAPSVNHQHTNNVEYEVINLSGVQQTIASRMVQSKQEIPHFYIEMEVNLTELIKVKDGLRQTLRTTLTHWFMLSAGRAAAKTPVIGQSWHHNTVHEAKNIDISFAVEIEDGVITPILKNVDKLGLGEVVHKMSDLIDRAKHKKLKPSEYQGGILTISNMGSWGVSRVIPIINPPQSAIIGIGCTRDRLSMDTKGSILSEKVLSVTLSSDHRILNGTQAAAFLVAFKLGLEQPLSLLVK